MLKAVNENITGAWLDLRKKIIISLILLVFLAQPIANAGESTNSVTYRITWEIEARNYGSTDATDVIVKILVFDDLSGWASQQVISEDVQLSAGTYELVSENDNRFLNIFLETLGSGESETVTATQVVKVNALNSVLDNDIVQDNIPSELLEYTLPVENLWESDDPLIVDKAHELTDNYPNPYDKVGRITNFVSSYLTYEKRRGVASAVWAYVNQVGDCNEFTNLFIALARAAGLPANFVHGYVYSPAFGEDLDQMAHAWAVVYLPNAGWVSVDATWGLFGEVDEEHIAFGMKNENDLIHGSTIAGALQSTISYSPSYAHVTRTITRTIEAIGSGGESTLPYMWMGIAIVVTIIIVLSILLFGTGKRIAPVRTP